jgi:hypothetical protein
MRPNSQTSAQPTNLIPSLQLPNAMNSSLFGWAGTGWAGPAAGNHLLDGLVASRSARWKSYNPSPPVALAHSPPPPRDSPPSPPHPLSPPPFPHPPRHPTLPAALPTPLPPPCPLPSSPPSPLPSPSPSPPVFSSWHHGGRRTVGKFSRWHRSGLPVAVVLPTRVTTQPHLRILTSPMRHLPHGAGTVVV